MDKFKKLKEMLGVPMKVLADLDQSATDRLENTELFKQYRKDIADAAIAAGQDPEEAIARAKDKEDKAMQFGMMAGTIGNAGKVFQSPAAKAMSRAKANMAPKNTPEMNRAIAEKLTKIEEVPVKLMEGGVASPTSVKDLNPYKARPMSEAAAKAVAPVDPAVVQELLKKLKR